MAAKFKTGEIVELKSGGPRMTVAGIDDRHIAPNPSMFKCQWFGGKKLESGYFPAESLQVPQDKNAEA